MPLNTDIYTSILQALEGKATLVAVSKTKPIADIQTLYDMGQRDFGENYVQELVEKAAALPTDIRWHFIGHLQSNKVKYIAPFVHLIHGVDSMSLLKEINKQALKNNRKIACLLQVHISTEATKFGFDAGELAALTNLQEFTNTAVAGFMGMASFSDNETLVKGEFLTLQGLLQKHPQLITATDTYNKISDDQPILSMGMSGDYPLALEYGSNMVRIGSLLFGERN